MKNFSKYLKVKTKSRTINYTLSNKYFATKQSALNYAQNWRSMDKKQANNKSQGLARVAGQDNLGWRVYVA